MQIRIRKDGANALHGIPFDRGRSWIKLDREFGEVRAIAWQPD